MRKSFKLSLVLTVSFVSLSFAEELNKVYTLDDNKIQEYELKGKLENKKDIIQSEENVEELNTDENFTPNIIKEDIPGGYVEKLIDENNLVIAEKTVIGNEITKKVLYYYHPNKKISKKILASNNDSGFYAEEFYSNGNISSKASYLNDGNKIGKEKIYDINGVLRQEIPWAILKEDENKPFNERKSKREGNVLTYYPNGKLAASFSIGKDGDNIFYNQSGEKIKEISNKELLNFSNKEYTPDCSNITLQLSLEELVELYEDEGDISYDKCGLPYRELFLYEVVDMGKQKSTVVSYDEYGMIRKITPYEKGQKNGKIEKYDAQGNLTAEISYKNGIKDGFAIGYFPTKEIAFKKYYEKGKVIDKLNCYFPTGELAATINYIDGKKEGVVNIFGPNPRQIEYKDDIIVEKGNKSQRQILSQNSILKNIDSKCLDISKKIKDISQDIEDKEKQIVKDLSIVPPKGCEDLSKYTPKQSKYWCYDENNIIKGSYTPLYNKGRYSSITYYFDGKNKEADVFYNNKIIQGISKKYDLQGNVIAEISFNDGKMSDTSRSYYENGIVKNIISIEDDRKLYNNYLLTGELDFSSNYDKNMRSYTYISQPEKNKKIYVKYHDGKIDNIKEVNAKNKSNYIEYNLAIGEYSIFKDKELIKGGNICGYEEIAENIDVIKINPKPIISSNQTLDAEDKIETVKENKQNIIENKELIESLKQLDNEIQSIVKENEIKEENKDKVKETLNINTNKSLVPVDVKIEEDINALETNIKEISETVASTKDSLETELHISDETAIPPVINHQDAPIIEGIESIEELDKELSEYKLDEEMLENKSQSDLASQNIGPVSRPDINSLSETVSKSKVDVDELKPIEDNEEKVEKVYYPNNKLRKTIKTIGARTKEVKEYSKTGLLLKDTIYNDDDIVIEKYSGSGDISRKTRKNYLDNVIEAFISREDFYNTGNLRYKVSKANDVLLFSESSYYPNGKLKEEVIQYSPFEFATISYNEQGQKEKEQVLSGINIFDITYNNGEVSSVKINNDELPIGYAQNRKSILEGSSKVYNKNKQLVGDINVNNKQTTINEYYDNSKLKTEITLFNNGEITLKSYSQNGELDKFAYLTKDGKLYIQKPEVRVIPNYRERYWVDYNNPNWVENVDKYSIKSIGKLNLDIVAYMLTELKIETPESIKQLYLKY